MKAEPAADAPVGNVVHLRGAFETPPVPPASIGFGRRIGSAAAAVLWCVIVVAALGTLVIAWLLWTGDTPGWWFALIFTAMPVLFVGGCAIGLADSRRLSRLEGRLAARWTAERDRVRLTSGRVIDREVHLTEHGSVSSFVLSVETDQGRSLRARWYRTAPGNDDRALLQPQAPVVGSDVRIWAMPEASAADPHVVEALDPSARPASAR